jgi:GH25 family lysozyme M1 (1,4-beta-N-acetylmuramidase)
MTLENNAFGTDLDRYSTSADGVNKPNFELIRKLCAFVAARAGVSWGYVDMWFRYYWENLLGFNRMAYHVIYFGEDAQRQMDNFFRIVNPIESDKLVLDLELANVFSKYQITQTTLKCLNICKARMGVYPIAYSRAEWVNAHLQVSDLPTLDWWLAQYLLALKYPAYTPEALDEPDLPIGVSKWLIKQTGDRCSGKAIGVPEYYNDYNRWNGGNEDVNRYFGREIELPLTLEEKVADHEKRISALERI